MSRRSSDRFTEELARRGYSEHRSGAVVVDFRPRSRQVGNNVTYEYMSRERLFWRLQHLQRDELDMVYSALNHYDPLNSFVLVVLGLDGHAVQVDVSDYDRTYAVGR